MTYTSWDKESTNAVFASVIKNNNNKKKKPKKNNQTETFFVQEIGILKVMKQTVVQA